MEHALAPAGTISWAAAASADARGARWRSRPVASFLIRLVAVVVPAVSSFAVARWLGAALAEPVGLREATAWWVFVAVGSGATLLAVDRVTRGLLPLAMLLRLAIAFPREAPSYAQVALRAVTARRNVERLRASDTAGDTSAQAAADLAALVSTAARHGGLTRSHAERVCAYADAIAAELGLGHDDREQVRWVALLHDVGELSVRGGSNGSLAARIVAVADVYDTLTLPTASRPALTPTQAREQIRRGSGTQFDPEVVRALLAIPARRLRRAGGASAWLARVPGAREVSTVLAASGASVSGAVAAIAVVVAAAVGGIVPSARVDEPLRASPATPVAAAQSPVEDVGSAALSHRTTG